MFRISSRVLGITLLITGILVLLAAALLLWNIPNIVAYWADVFHAHRECNPYVCRRVPFKPFWHTMLAFVASMGGMVAIIAIGCATAKKGIALCKRKSPRS
jgi:hypothetical protein